MWIVVDFNISKLQLHSLDDKVVAVFLIRPRNQHRGAKVTNVVFYRPNVVSYSSLFSKFAKLGPQSRPFANFFQSWVGGVIE